MEETWEQGYLLLTSAAVNLSLGPPNTRSLVPNKCSRVMSSRCRDTVQWTFNRDCARRGQVQVEGEDRFRWKERTGSGGRRGQVQVQGEDRFRWKERTGSGGRRGQVQVEGEDRFRWKERTG